MDLFERAAQIPLFSLVQHLARLDPTARIRFLGDPRLVFHASEVSELRERWTDAGRVFEVRTPVLGIVGAESPLASFFTEDVLRDLAFDEERALVLYDTFHHRLVELLIDADRRTSPGRAVRSDGADVFTSHARAVARSRLAPAAILDPRAASPGLSREAMLGLGRILGVRPRVTEALDAALQVALPMHAIRIEDLLARDVAIADDQRAILGQHASLGMSLLGGHVPLQTDLLRLSLGPVDREELAALSPEGRLHGILADVVEQMTSGLVCAELEVTVAHGHEPALRLGDEGARLGPRALLGRAPSAAPLRARIPLSTDGIVTFGSDDDTVSLER